MSFAELGLFGGLLFLGAFFAGIVSLYRLGGKGVAIADPRLARLRPYLLAMVCAYAAGLGTNLDRITAQAQLLSAQLSLASEEFNYKVSYLNLLRSMGRLPLPETLAPPPGTPTSRPTPVEMQTPGPVRAR